MRWRAWQYLKGEKDDNEENPEDKEHYGLNCRKSPPHVEELEAFEDSVGRLIESITFKKTRDKFQENLQKDVARIKQSKAIFVPADKTRNVYEVGLDQYNKLLRDNIT